MTVDYSKRKAAKAQGKKRKREDESARPKRRKHRKVTEAPCYKPPVITEDDLEWPEEEGGPGGKLTKSGLGTAVHLLDPAILEREARQNKKQQQRQQRRQRPDMKCAASQQLPFTLYGDVIAKFLARRGFGEVTQVQAECWKEEVRGRDVVVLAPTGSGKTLAYLLALARDCMPQGPSTSAHRPSPSLLILVPTRELAQQVAREARDLRATAGLTTCAIFGGVPKHEQQQELKMGPGIVVGTPGRVSDLLGDGSLHLGCVAGVAVDEADKMLAAGLGEQVADILRKVQTRKGFEIMQQRDESPDVTEVAIYMLLQIKLPDEMRPVRRQLECNPARVIMASATMPQQLRHQCGLWLRKPAEVTVQLTHASISPTVTQVFGASASGQRGNTKYGLFPGREAVIHVCAEHKKDGKLLKHLAKIKEAAAGMRNQPRVLVFANTVQAVRTLCSTLEDSSFRVAQLHGDRSQSERQAALAAFRCGQVQILVTTNVASRGLDIRGLPYVVLYDFPSNLDDYIHRVGRTGRLGLHGHVLGFFTRNLAKLAPDVVALLQHHKQNVDPNLLRLAEAAETAAKMAAIGQILQRHSPQADQPSPPFGATKFQTQSEHEEAGTNGKAAAPGELKPRGHGKRQQRKGGEVVESQEVTSIGGVQPKTRGVEPAEGVARGRARGTEGKQRGSEGKARGTAVTVHGTRGGGEAQTGGRPGWLAAKQGKGMPGASAADESTGGSRRPVKDARQGDLRDTPQQWYLGAFTSGGMVGTEEGGSKGGAWKASVALKRARKQELRGTVQQTKKHKAGEALQATLSGKLPQGLAELHPGRGGPSASQVEVPVAVDGKAAVRDYSRVPIGKGRISLGVPIQSGLWMGSRTTAEGAKQRTTKAVKYGKMRLARWRKVHIDSSYGSAVAKPSAVVIARDGVRQSQAGAGTTTGVSSKGGKVGSDGKIVGRARARVISEEDKEGAQDPVLRALEDAVRVKEAGEAKGLRAQL